MTRFRFPLLTLLAGLAAAAALLGPVSKATASAELRKGLGEIAKSIKQLLDGRSEDSIGVGPFTGPANFPTSAGPGIQQVLSEELQKVGITVKKRARLGINLDGIGPPVRMVTKRFHEQDFTTVQF